MVAVGNLAKIWLDVPEADDMEELAAAFKDYFGTQWEDTMTGGDRPFVFHKDWGAYFSVTGLQPASNKKLSDLPAGVKKYNIIIGV